MITPDSWRDAFALVSAVVHADEEGQAAVLANAEPVGLAAALAHATAGALAAYVREVAGEEQFARLTRDQLAGLVKHSFIDGLDGIRHLGGPQLPRPPGIAKGE